MAERDTLLAEERRGRAAVGAELAAVRAQAKQATEAEAERNAAMHARDAERQAKLDAFLGLERVNAELKGEAQRLETALADTKRKLAEEKAERAHAAARLNEMMVSSVPSSCRQLLPPLQGARKRCCALAFTSAQLMHIRYGGFAQERSLRTLTTFSMWGCGRGAHAD